MTWDGERARQLRRALRLTQQQLAEAVGVSRLTIYYWEASKRMPSNLHLGRLGEFLGVGRHELVGADAGPDLRDLRRTAGFTQAEAAQQVGVSTSSVWRYETGRYPLPAPYERWANAYRVSIPVIETAATRSRQRP